MGTGNMGIGGHLGGRGSRSAPSLSHHIFFMLARHARPIPLPVPAQYVDGANPGPRIYRASGHVKLF